MTTLIKIQYHKKAQKQFVCFPNEFSISNDLRTSDHFIIDIKANQIALTRSVPVSVLKREYNKYLRRVHKFGFNYAITRSSVVIATLTKTTFIKKHGNRLLV